MEHASNHPSHPITLPGQLVVEYYLRTYGPPSASFRWAIAGRNQAKLDGVKQDLVQAKGLPEGSKIETIIGDSDDEAFLAAMAQRTKVVVTTVGPYAQYGRKLVAACAAHGTHYADLTGEVPFIKDMIEAYEPAAKASGARILHCCGFDSEPSDLGTHVMYTALKKRGLTPTSIKFIVGPSAGGVSGGTVHSLAGVVKDRRLKDLANPYVLLPGGKKGSAKVLERKAPAFDKDVQRWEGPFVMAAINTRVVARTSALLGRDPFTYMETQSFQKGVLGCLQACALTFFLGFTIFLMAVPPVRWLILKAIPPGSGPSEEARKNGFALIYLVGKGTDRTGKEVVLKGHVRITGDPGYQETAKMIAETGMALAKDKVTGPAGFLTPASALGDGLVERLKARGLTVTVDE